MKKILSALLSVLIAVVCTVNVFAANSATVYADQVSAKAGEEIEIPIMISNNPGIMGFKLNVSFDGSVFNNANVVKGTVTNSGMFNNSIKSADQSNFSIVWSGSSDVKTNSTLCTLSLNIDENTPSGTYEIKISYSKPDTFNENWDDVQLNCKSISVVIENDNQSEPEVKLTFWQKVANFFKNVWNSICSIFKK